MYLLQMELRYNLASGSAGQLTPVVFLDHARSRINHDPWPGFTGNNVRSLSAVGVGLEMVFPASVFLRGWYARKVGTEPATADADRSSRVWAQFGVLF